MRLRDSQVVPQDFLTILGAIKRGPSENRPTVPKATLMPPSASYRAPSVFPWGLPRGKSENRSTRAAVIGLTYGGTGEVWGSRGVKPLAHVYDPSVRLEVNSRSPQSDSAFTPESVEE